MPEPVPDLHTRAGQPKPTKVLILHIEVPGVWADDLPQSVAEIADGEPTPEDYLFVVTEEWTREQVGLTIVTLPGEKNTNDDFEVHAHTGRVVGAQVREINHG
jgi:hypothetical protein